MDEKERRKIIDQTLAQLEKQFGKGSILRLGSGAVVPVSVISTGSISIDAALGVGGVPRGRVVEIFGPESSGKTTIALQVIAEAQRNGGSAAFIDAEHALDPAYARKLSQALRKLTGAVSKTNTCLLFINQIREKIGVMFGNPETTTGGRALKFYSSVRLDIRRIAAIKDGDNVIGNRTRVKVVKNKVASPFREAEFDILYGQGTSREGDLLDTGVTRNVIEKSGSWFSYKGQRIGQGRDTARQFLIENPEIRGKIDSELRSLLGLLATCDNGLAKAAIALVPQK